MNKETSVSLTDRRVRPVLFLLPLINLLSVITVNYISGIRDMRALLSVTVFVLCFDFVAVYYIELRKNIVVSDLAAAVITLAPSLIILSLYIKSIPVMCAAVILPLMLVSCSADITLSFLYALGLFTYSSLFSIGDIRFLLKLILIVCLSAMLARVTTRKALGVSILTVTFFSIVLQVIDSRFILIVLIAPVYLIFYLEVIAGLVIGNLVYRHYFVSAPDEAAASDVELGRADALPETLSDDVSHESVDESGPAFEADKEAVPDTDVYEVPAAEEDNDICRITVPDPELVMKLEHQAELLSVLRAENARITTELDSIRRTSSHTVSAIISQTFEFSMKLRRERPAVFRNRSIVARIASEAAELINCDNDLAYAIALYQDSPRLFGEDYAAVLREELMVPEHVIKAVEHISNKPNKYPMPREAGIVLLTDDIIKILKYVRSAGKGDVSMDRVVTNALNFRKDQNVLKQAGFTNEEIQLLKLFFIDKGASYDITD